MNRLLPSCVRPHTALRGHGRSVSCFVRLLRSSHGSVRARRSCRAGRKNVRGIAPDIFQPVFSFRISTENRQPPFSHCRDISQDRCRQSRSHSSVIAGISLKPPPSAPQPFFSHCRDLPQDRRRQSGSLFSTSAASRQNFSPASFAAASTASCVCFVFAMPVAMLVMQESPITLMPR